jgi:hypothetical protein
MAEQEKVVGFVGIERVRADRSAGHYVIGGSRPSAAQTTCLVEGGLGFARAAGSRHPITMRSLHAPADGRRGPTGHPPGRRNDKVLGGEGTVSGICS